MRLHYTSGMAPHYLVDVNLQAASGIPEDDVHNTFVIDANGVDVGPGNTLAHMTPIVSFYNNPTNPDMATKLATFIGRSRSRTANGIIVKFFDITGKLGINPATGRPYPHGSAVAEDSFTLENSGANPPLPEEVALVTTLRADDWDAQPVEAPDGADLGDAPDRPRARYTGRIYLGPFENNGASATGPAWHSRPSLGLQNVILDSIERMAELYVAAGMNLGVWSRKDGVVRDVTEFQVDDAWDTQRRRGPKATARLSRLL